METIGETMNQDGRFSGDMDRNEVEIDLNKFMAMIQENNDLKQKIFIIEGRLASLHPFLAWKRVWDFETNLPHEGDLHRHENRVDCPFP